MKKIYILIENDCLIGWSDTRGMDAEIEVEVEDNHPIFNSNPRLFVYKNGQLIKSDEIKLQRVKNKKDEELNNACNQSILDGFDYMVNDTTYHFSFDTEAQFNFQGIQMLFLSNTIESILWTVTNVETNEYERITIDRDLMTELTMAILIHKDSNISRYRDDLSVRLKNATSIKEVESINW